MAIGMKASRVPTFVLWLHVALCEDMILPQGDMKLLWFSPVLIQPLPEPDSFSQTIASAALESYYIFISQVHQEDESGFSQIQNLLRQIVCNNNEECLLPNHPWQELIEPYHLNDAWYEWQRNNQSSFHQLPEFKKLKKYIMHAQLKLRESTGISSVIEEISDEKLFCWSSIHRIDITSPSFHLPHTHSDSSFSSVFYAQTPLSSGAIWFHDPRGPRPPFDQTFEISHPKKGELVMFPSWLVHEVRPNKIPSSQVKTFHNDFAKKSEGDYNNLDYRVSISCNHQGPWKLTADLSVGFNA